MHKPVRFRWEAHRLGFLQGLRLSDRVVVVVAISEAAVRPTLAMLTTNSMCLREVVAAVHRHRLRFSKTCRVLLAFTR